MAPRESTKSQAEARNEAQRAHAQDLRRRARLNNFLARVRAARKRKGAQQRIGNQVKRSRLRAAGAKRRAQAKKP